MLGILFVIATPIGNMKDITFRAIEALKNADIIFAEDTRTATNLLKHFKIEKKQILSFEEHNEEQRTSRIISMLEGQKNVALLSESGTPLISDPGFRLVRAARMKKIQIIPIPGPSAVTAALAVSGCATDIFTFMGFPPRKTEQRKKFLKNLTNIPHTIVLFEAPHRILHTLEEMIHIMPKRNIVLCREMTKIFEEFVHGSPAEILSILRNRNEIKGEITLVIDKEETESEKQMITMTIDQLKDTLIDEANIPPSRTASIIARLTGIPKAIIYDDIIKKKPDSE